MLCAVCTVMAENINALVLHLASGNQVVYMLEEQPVVTFENDDLVITAQSKAVRYLLSDVVQFTYKEESSGISQLIHSNASFSIEGNNITVSCFEPLSEISVLSVSGAPLVVVKTDANGNASFAIPTQANGVCVIRSSVANFKIALR